MLPWLWAVLEVPIVPSDFPIKQHVLIARAGANVVNYRVALRGFGPRIYHDANMLDPTAQIPGNYIAGQIVIAIIGDW